MLLFAVLLAACPEGPTKADGGARAARPPIAHLEAKLGQVWLEREGVRTSAELGYLWAGDSLETGPEGQARVRFPGERLVEIGPDAHFSISEDATGLILKVDRGLVLSRVPAAAAEREPLVALSIQTPFGLTRVGTGKNELSVQVGKEEAQVKVLLGSVQFLSRNGTATSAEAGEILAVTLGEVQLQRKDQELVLDPISVMVQGGKAEIRRRGSRSWKAAGREGEPLAQGDGVRVTGGSSVLRLEGSGSSLTLERGAEIVFLQSQRQGGAEEARLELKKGDLGAALARGKRSRLFLEELELRADDGGQAAVVRTSQGLRVIAAAGDFSVLRGGTEEKLSAGQLVEVPLQGAPEVRQVAREELLLPSRPALKVFHPGVRGAALFWEGGERDFEVEVAKDSSFQEIVLQGRVHQSWVNVPIPPRGALYWRVREPSGGQELAQGSALFSPEPRARELSRLRNEVQDGAEKTSIFFQDKPPAVTFIFKPDEQAARYRLMVYRAGELTKAVTEREAEEPRLPLEAGVLAEGQYLWSVTPLSSTGEELRGGKMNKLEIVYDNAVPDLMVESPRNGDPVQGNQVPISGVAPVGAKLWVNGRPVELDEKARFDSTATPLGRPPLVIFRLSPGSGPEVYTVRALRRGN